MLFERTEPILPEDRSQAYNCDEVKEDIDDIQRLKGISRKGRGQETEQ